MWSSTTPSMNVFPSFWTTHRTTNGSFSRFHFGALIPSYLHYHVFWSDIWGPLWPNFIIFWPLGGRLVHSSSNIPNLLIIFPNFFHTILDMAQITTSFNCKHPLMCVHTSHWPYGYPLLMLHPWQWTHGDPWCSSWLFCCDYVRCWLPCGTKKIKCTSLSHIQFLSSTNWHCAHQRWNLHLSWHCNS
jgi:hypothetical protein